MAIIKVKAYKHFVGGLCTGVKEFQRNGSDLKDMGQQKFSSFAITLSSN